MRILIASSEGNCLEGLNADIRGGVSFETFTFVLEASRCGRSTSRVAEALSLSHVGTVRAGPTLYLTSREPKPNYRM